MDPALLPHPGGWPGRGRRRLAWGRVAEGVTAKNGPPRTALLFLDAPFRANLHQRCIYFFLENGVGGNVTYTQEQTKSEREREREREKRETAARRPAGRGPDY